jgi:biotin operon repressor
MAKIFITPLMRTVWHQMIALDKTLLEDGTLALPPAATRVAVAIGRHFDNKTADTFVSQPTLAAELGVSEKTVWSAIQALRKRGHLVVKRGGRRSNYYGMPVEKVVAECEIYRRKPEINPVAEYGIKTEIPQSTPLNPVAGYGLSPSPSEKIISTGAGSFVTLLQTRKKEKEARQGKKADPTSSNPWQVIKDDLVRSGRVSQAERTSWLDKLNLHATSNDVLTLRGSPFTVLKVVERFQAKIEEAWQGLSGVEAGSKATVEFVSAPSAASLKRS